MRRVSAVTQRFHGRRALSHLRAALRRAGAGAITVTLSPADDPRRSLLGAALSIPVELIKTLNDATLRRLARRRQ